MIEGIREEWLPISFCNRIGFYLEVHGLKGLYKGMVDMTSREDTREEEKQLHSTYRAYDHHLEDPVIIDRFWRDQHPSAVIPPIGDREQGRFNFPRHPIDDEAIACR